MAPVLQSALKMALVRAWKPKKTKDDYDEDGKLGKKKAMSPPAGTDANKYGNNKKNENAQVRP